VERSVGKNDSVSSTRESKVGKGKKERRKEKGRKR
jgi:hypothetical protein